MDYLDFKDRKTGLVIYGIILLVLGGICVLMTLFTIVGLLMMSAMKDQMPPNAQLSARMMVPGILMYVGMAVLFIVIGIGSIRARRWARAIVTAGSAVCLALGTIALASTAYTILKMPSTPNATAGMMLAIKVISMAFLVFIYLLLPGAHLVFYARADVKATCEHRDPTVRWTDRCPLPVLALVIVLLIGAFFISFNMFTGMAFPLFGAFLTGFPAIAMYLTSTVVLLVLVRLCYRLSTVGWVLTAAFMALSGLSGLVTFLSADFIELYQGMGLSEPQMQQLKQSNQMTSGVYAIMVGVSTLAFLAYHVYTLRFFNEQTRAAMAAVGQETFAPGICAGCGEAFADDDLVELEGKQVCINCKPELIQRLREGLHSS